MNAPREVASRARVTGLGRTSVTDVHAAAALRLRVLHWTWLALVLLAFMCATSAHARGPATTLSEVSLRELPREARDLYDRIRAGGPFQEDRDGVVFGNREGILPSQKRGYYHEYTVRTP